MESHSYVKYIIYEVQRNPLCTSGFKDLKSMFYRWENWALEKQTCEAHWASNWKNGHVKPGLDSPRALNYVICLRVLN